MNQLKDTYKNKSKKIINKIKGYISQIQLDDNKSYYM